MFSKEVYVARRRELRRRLSDQSGIVVFLGNVEAPAQYKDNCYKWRQNSNWLYYFGISRRFGYQQMGKHHRAAPGKILIGIDVSESIKDVQVARFYHAVSNVFNRGIKHLEIFQFDTELKTKKPIPFRHRSQIKLVGKGGTNFQPIFDYIIKHQFEYDGLIIFSDGSGPAPVIHHKLRTKVLWVLYDEFCYNWYHKPLLESGLVTILQ